MSPTPPLTVLSEEEQIFQQTIRDFAEREIAPRVAKMDQQGHYDPEILPMLFELGVMAIETPDELGGAGGSFFLSVLAVEELSRVDQSMGITLEAAVGLGINPIHEFGTSEQKQRWLPDLVAGRALAGFGLTEPDAGSDAGATATRAELD